MLVESKRQHRALEVLSIDVVQWHNNWPRWAQKMITLEGVMRVQQLVSSGGCIIIEDIGPVSLINFKKNYREI